MGRLALAQPRSVRDAVAVPWRRVSAVALGLAAALALLYLGARETSVFAVRTIEVSGGPASVRDAVRVAAASVAGEGLVGLDGDALLADLEALPAVRSASYDRAFPNTLRIFVQPERPIALVHVGSSSWILSERGRVIRPVPSDAAPRLPEFRLPDGSAVRPGAFVADPTTRVVLGALAVVPKRFPAGITSVHLESGVLTVGLETSWGEPQLRLGNPVDIDVKFAVAALLLRSLPSDERASVGYIDVSVPERTVVGANPQVEG